MKQRVWSTLVTLAALVLAGCGKTSAPVQATAGAPAGSDDAQVASVLAGDPGAVNEDVYQQSSEPQTVDQGGGFAAIRPLQFWRTITDVQSSIDTQFGPPGPDGRPTNALVTIHRRLLGTFNVAGLSVTPGDTTREVVHKPLEDLWTRRVALVRVVTADDPDGRWRLAGTSGVDVHTRAGATHVVSLHIGTETLDTTITDPLELHRLRNAIRLPAGAEVSLTATTGDPTDVVFFYGGDMRRRFKNNGDGTFTFTFTNGRTPGLRHFGVDAFSHGSLFDDQAPYDSDAWILQYVQSPQAMPTGS